MKKLIFALCMIFVLSSFSYGGEKENKEEITKLEMVYKQSISYDSLLGTCKIRIYNRNTGETVYYIELPANTQEACQQMAQNTFEAFLAGEL